MKLIKFNLSNTRKACVLRKIFVLTISLYLLILSRTFAQDTHSSVVMPAITKWNYFKTNQFPSVTIPDNANGEPAAMFVWNNIYTSSVNYDESQSATTNLEKLKIAVNELKRVGFNVFDHVSLQRDYEFFSPAEYLTFLDPAKNLQIHQDLGGNRILDQQFVINHFQSVEGVAASFGATRAANGKRKVALCGYDLESVFYETDGKTEIGGFRTREIEAMVALAQKDVIEGLISPYYFSYGHSGGNVSTGYLSGLADQYFWKNGLTNLIENSSYRGKTLLGDSQIAGGSETSYYWEDVIPVGTMIKDQNGNNWFTSMPFGPQENTPNSTMDPGVTMNNTLHWAAKVAADAGYESQKLALTNQKFIQILKVNNQTENGFKYNHKIKEYLNDRYNGEENNPTKNSIRADGSVEPIGMHYIPNYIAEGQVVLSMFCGTYGIRFWDSMHGGPPVTKSTTEQEHGFNEQLGIQANYDYEPISWFIKGVNELGIQHTTTDGKVFSFLDLKKESDTKYLNELTEISVDNGVHWELLDVRKFYKNSLPPVRAVVNDRLGVIMIYCQEAYNECSSQSISNVNVKYNNQIFSVPILPNNAVNIVLFSLVPTCSTSTPSLTSSSTTVPSTLTVVGCNGRVIWSDDASNLSSQRTITTVGTYSVACQNTGCTVSGNSSSISLSASTSSCGNTAANYCLDGQTGANHFRFRSNNSTKVDIAGPKLSLDMGVSPFYGNAGWLQGYAGSSGCEIYATNQDNINLPVGSYRVSVGFTGTQTLKLYVNGVEKWSQTRSDCQNGCQLLPDFSSVVSGDRVYFSDGSGTTTCSTSTPSLTSSSTTVPSTLTVGGCNGRVIWSDDASNLSSQRTITTVGTYWVACQNTGCTVSGNSSSVSLIASTSSCGNTSANYCLDGQTGANHFRFRSSNSAVINIAGPRLNLDMGVAPFYGNASWLQGYTGCSGCEIYPTNQDNINLPIGSYRVSVDFTGTRTLKLYVNGVEKWTETRSDCQYGCQLLPDFSSVVSGDRVYFSDGSGTTAARLSVIDETNNNEVQDLESGVSIKIVPNPTDRESRVEFKLTEEQPVRIMVMDIRGNVNHIYDIDGVVGINGGNLDLQKELSGTYFIRILLKNKTLVSKVIKL